LRNFEELEQQGCLYTVN